jgi:MFS family permease
MLTLSGPSSNIYLVSLVNTLIKGVCLLLVGSVSDAVGRRYFMIGGQTFSVIGAILAATSKNVNSLIGANVFIGMAGSAQVLYPLLSQEIVPNKYRGWSQGIITLLVLPSIGFGPIVGRTMVVNLHDIGGWR